MDSVRSKKWPYFEVPDENEEPLGFWRIVVIVLSSHLGVRSKKNRIDDFKRANGLHLVMAGFVYFFFILAALIFLVRYISQV